MIALKNGTTISASNLDTIPKIGVMDIYQFKHISKPKDLQLAELVRLFEVLDLPTGAITDPSNREVGLEKLISKTQEIVRSTVVAKSRLDSDFTLWGEPLVASHIAEQYKQATKRVTDTLGNFTSRFNTVPKLNNFTYTMDEIEKLAVDIATVKTVMEYDTFKTECGANVGYLMNVEPLPINDELKEKIEAAKVEFRQARDDIGANGKFGETAAMEANDALSKAKDAYIDIYFEEHKKRRLTATEYKKKVELMDSAAFTNLKRLSEIDEILSVARLKIIETDLAALKVCYELTPEHLKHKHYCEKCMFQLGGGDPLVKGRIDEIEERNERLTAEWTDTLLNTISDPLVLGQKEFLSAEQRTAISKFVKDKMLPNKIDQFFVNAIKDLLKGFDAVTVDGAELIDKLAALGACDTETFKQKIDAIIADIAKGKDKTKLRIIIRG